MRGVIVAAHGSRAAETAAQMEKTVDLMRCKTDGMPVVLAYVGGSGTSFEDGIEGLVKMGVDEILVVPCFLVEGYHVKEDIPKRIEKAIKIYPDISIRLGRVIGSDSRIADILADRAAELCK